VSGRRRAAADGNLSAGVDWDFEGIATWLALIAAMVVLSTGWRLLLGQGPPKRLLSDSSRRAAALAVRHLAPRPQPLS
jgi:hypothetical protein